MYILKKGKRRLTCFATPRYGSPYIWFKNVELRTPHPLIYCKQPAVILKSIKLTGVELLTPGPGQILLSHLPYLNEADETYRPTGQPKDVSALSQP